MADGTKPAGIRDISAALSVSIGTVDRAMHGRSGISEKTKARVLQMAAELGYTPNLAAQTLRLNRPFFRHGYCCRNTSLISSSRYARGYGPPLPPPLVRIL